MKVRISPQSDNVTKIGVREPSLDRSGLKIELEFFASHDIKDYPKDVGEALMAMLLAP
jgi:hypothetical protein